MRSDRAEGWKQWAKINRALAGSLDSSQVLRGITDSTLQLIKTDAALVMVADSQDILHVRATSGIDISTIDAASLSGPMGELVIERVREHLGLSPEISIAAVPIVCGQAVNGVLITLRERALDSEESWMLHALADQAALALRNARYHEMELDALNRQKQESELALIESERRTAELVRGQERWLQAIFDLAPSPILLFEPETKRFLFSNRSAKMISSANETWIPAAICDRLAQGESFDGLQVEYSTKERTRTLLLHAEKFPPLYGYPAVCVLIFHDITPIKEVEEELRRADTIKDEFLATLSHELRTPITVILGWAGMLKLASQDEELRNSAVAAIERSVRAQSKLIDDLLDVSRIIKGTLEIERREIDLSAAISDAVNSMRPIAVERGVDLREMIEPGVQILGDPQRFQQIAGNLLSNSMKFTPKGGDVTVVLNTAGPDAVFAIADSGQGISPEFLPFVFDRFRQQASSQTRKHGGLGLGLSIVKSIVELHHGSITAHSGGEDQGTSMTIRVPLAHNREDADFDDIGRAVQAGRDGALLQGLEILLVEDDPETMNVFRTTLERAGAHVTTASSAGEALTILKERPPQLIVSDIGLPDMDGYGFMRQVRATSMTSIPAIAVTAYAGVKARQKSFDAGFDDHLVKPIPTDELVAAVARVASMGLPAAHTLLSVPADVMRRS